MSGAALVHGAIGCPVLRWRRVGLYDVRYPGTDLAYSAMGCPVLLWDVRYWPSVWCYFMCGTEVAYGARRRGGGCG
eukprot:223394-Rhodomonas_salina.2